MQHYQIKNESFTSDVKYITVNSYPQDSIRQKNFIIGLENARNILKELQDSLKDTRECEKQLMRCRSSHAHSDKVKEWWCNDHDEHYECFKSDSDTERSGNGVLLQPWSTMSIVCLEYQYEVLAKRYKALLEENEARCKAASDKDEQLVQLQELVKKTHAHLVDAHKTLLAVGEKYMAMRQRKHAQKYIYSKKVKLLKKSVESLLDEADKARQELNDRLVRALKAERQGGTALLLLEIRKCNQLCLENLRLKAQTQQLTLQRIPWDYETY